MNKNSMFSYLNLRIGQITVIISALGSILVDNSIEFKSGLVRKMFWGRTSFYKSTFHVIIIAITSVSLYSGLGTRIANVRYIEGKSTNVSEGYIVDSDILYQVGSFYPNIETDEESDSVFVTYIVKSGDSLEAIASETGIKANTLRWANNIPIGRDTLSVGQSIKIPKVDGVLYTVKEGDTIDTIMSKVLLKDKEADRFTFIELNKLAYDENQKLIPGKIVILYDASLPIIVAKPRTPNKPVSRTSFINQPAQPSQAPAGKFVNPLQLCNYRFVRGYNYNNHTGVDLGVASGCWVVAAASGVVSRVGFCQSLGTCVVIKHANGYSTVYGHGNGVISVGEGQQVVAGQKIMQSGCTGRCSGPHLHLSLAANNQDVYGCYKCRINPTGIIPY